MHITAVFMAESIPCCGELSNNDSGKSEGHTTKFSRGIKVRRKTICRIAPQRRDTTPRNYEVVPQIFDSARRLLSVNDDIYGGGTRNSKDLTKVPWIFDNFGSDSARSLLSIHKDAYGRWNNRPAHAEGYTTALPPITKAIIEMMESPRCYIISPNRDTTSHYYGRAPLIEDLFADSARSRPSVKEDTYGGGIGTEYGQRDHDIIVKYSGTGQGYYGVSPPQVPFPIHPPEQKSTHRINSTVTAHPHEQKTTQ